jgi:branched-chain amino acid transport system ATP-binding protein
MSDTPAMTARGLVAGYLPGIHILHGVSVDVNPGEVRCVLGPNGTGKSTLLKAMFGFLPPVSGQVAAGGADLAGVPPHRMGGYGIVYLPQRPSVFPYLTVDVNLRLGTWTFRHERARVRASIEAAYARFPVLAERRSAQAGTLSGGQQRQLEIARALLTEPAIFLIDEPTASIEPRIAARIYALVQELARAGKAILLVDQNIRGALAIADHVYVLRNGRMFDEGPRAAFEGEVETLVSRWLYTRTETAH